MVNTKAKKTEIVLDAIEILYIVSFVSIFSGSAYLLLMLIFN